MRDRPIIFTGLLLFLVFATLPFWYDVAGAVTTKGPQPKLPANEKVCVAAVEFMKTSHMQLLLDMREQAVRQDHNTFAGLNGKTYPISLSNTCLKQCHGAKADFCDRCHDYAGVSPTCWSCHLDPSQTPAAMAASLARRQR